MKLALIFFLFACPALAQEKGTATAPPPACGSESARYVVKLNKLQHALTEPEPGKALIYFIQDKGQQSFGIAAAVETRIGIDGTWVGANRNNSYFSVSVEPGEHHICSAEQTNGAPDIQLAHLDAEAAGKIYYYRVSIVFTRAGLRFFLSPLDSDQAKYLIASFPQSESRPKN